MPASNDPLIGAPLGNYIVRERIGEGGSGVVYRADHPGIGKAVAVKVLKDEVAGDPDSLRRLMDEARIVSALQHRGIVGIFDYGIAPNGRQYVVMELLEGEPLDKLLKRRGKLTAAEAIPLLDETLAAVGAAHRQSVVHRDLKPGNIFLVRQEDGARYIKVLDFGIAKRATRPDGQVSQTAFRARGTPAYMAPEQAKGRKVSPRTDLYAVGVIAYELVTGELPFDGPTAVETLLKAAKEPPARLTEKDGSIPASLEELVLELLEKDPARRPQGAEQVRIRLRKIARELEAAGTRVDLRASGDEAAVDTPDQVGRPPPGTGDRATQPGYATPVSGWEVPLTESELDTAQHAAIHPPAPPGETVDVVPRKARRVPRWLFPTSGAAAGLAAVGVWVAAHSTPVSRQVPSPVPVPVEPLRVEPTRVEPTRLEPTPLVQTRPPAQERKEVALRPRAPAPSVRELKLQLDGVSSQVAALEKRSHRERPELRKLVEGATLKVSSGNLSDADRRRLAKELAEFAAQLEEP